MSLEAQGRWLAFLLIIIGFSHFEANSQTVSDSKNAEKAWDALIAAKGGRAKLHAVTNMVIGQYGDEWMQLYVFPDLKWKSSTHFRGGQWTSLFDRKRELLVKATEDGEIEIRSNYPWDWTLRDQLAFILETKWDKPSVIKVSRRKERNQTFDFIEANIGQLKVEFGYEPEEMLVRRVYKYENGELFRIWALDGYRSIDGIQMPSKIAELSGDEFLKKESFDYAPISFQFNVDYDPAIFQRPLKSTSSDAWKRKRN